MAFKMTKPWKNPRSDNFWFRRRVPARLVGFMGKREIKFSLGTADPELAGLRFVEETAKLERMWHEHLHGRQSVQLSQRQLSALSGEFYREMVAKHRDNPGSPFDWELMLKRDREKIARRFPGRSHMRFSFGAEARSFLDRKGYHLVGDTFNQFIDEFVHAKHLAAEQLRRNASKDWKEDPKADDFAKPEVLVSDGKVGAMDRRHGAHFGDGARDAADRAADALGSHDGEAQQRHHPAMVCRFHRGAAGYAQCGYSGAAGATEPVAAPHGGFCRAISLSEHGLASVQRGWAHQRWPIVVYRVFRFKMSNSIFGVITRACACG